MVSCLVMGREVFCFHFGVVSSYEEDVLEQCTDVEIGLGGCGLANVCCEG